MREPLGWVAVAFAIALSAGWVITLVWWLLTPGATDTPVSGALAALFGLMLGVVLSYANRRRNGH